MRRRRGRIPRRIHLGRLHSLVVDVRDLACAVGDALRGHHHAGRVVGSAEICPRADDNVGRTGASGGANYNVAGDRLDLQSAPTK